MKKISRIIAICMFLLVGCSNNVIKPYKNIEMDKVELSSEDKILKIDVMHPLNEDYYALYTLDLYLDENYEINKDKKCVGEIFLYHEEEKLSSDKTKEVKAEVEHKEGNVFVYEANVFYEADIIIEYDTVLEFTIEKVENTYKVDVVEKVKE